MKKECIICGKKTGFFDAGRFVKGICDECVKKRPEEVQRLATERTGTESNIVMVKSNTMMVIGFILLIVGLVLSGVQLFLKEDVSFFGSSIGSVNKLPESYLYVGLASAIIGVLLIVGGSD